VTKADIKLIEEWRGVANKFIRTKSSTPSELEACFIALQLSDPQLARKCKEEAKHRRK